MSTRWPTLCGPVRVSRQSCKRSVYTTDPNLRAAVRTSTHNNLIIFVIIFLKISCSQTLAMRSGSYRSPGYCPFELPLANETKRLYSFVRKALTKRCFCDGDTNQA